MIQMRLIAIVTATVGALTTVWLRAQAPAPFARTILQRADLSIPGKEGVMASVEFQPGGSSGRHTHPGEELAHVISGSIVVEIDGQSPRTVGAGEALIVPAGKIHTARNPETTVTKVAVTYVVDKGKPVATAVP